MPSLSRLSRSEAGHIDRLQSVVGQLRSDYNPPPQPETGLEGNLFSKLSRRPSGGGGGGPGGGKFNLIFYLGLKFGELRSS